MTEKIRGIFQVNSRYGPVFAKLLDDRDFVVVKVSDLGGWPAVSTLKRVENQLERRHNASPFEIFTNPSAGNIRVVRNPRFRFRRVRQNSKRNIFMELLDV